MTKGFHMSRPTKNPVLRTASGESVAMNDQTKNECTFCALKHMYTHFELSVYSR